MSYGWNVLDHVINYWVIKWLSIPVVNKPHSGSIFSRFFTSMTHTKMKKYVDLTYQVQVINYEIIKLLSNYKFF